MTQDRRMNDKLPTEQLVFTDAVLIAAAQEHLRTERAAACLLHVPNTVPQLYVAAGSKDALRGLLREEGTAQQDQSGHMPPVELTVERILQLVCDHTGKRISLNVEEVGQHIDFARAIEAEVERRCRESRHEIIEEAARRVEERAANIGPVEIIGEACHETANNVILNVAAAVRALKLDQSGERRCRAQRTNNDSEGEGNG